MNTLFQPNHTLTQYRAQRLPVQVGPAAWNVILGPAPTRPRLDKTVHADCAIIGSGFAGLSAAHRLRQLEPNARIAILEAGQVANGAAGRNSGFMVDLPHELNSRNYAGTGDDKKIIQLNRRAIAFATEAVAEYAICADYFDPVGKVNGAASEAANAYNQSYQQHLSQLGEKSEWLDAQQMFAMTGSRHYLSGLHTPGTVMLQPAGYIRGLAQGLAQQGVQIYENSPVTQLVQEAAHTWKVITPQGAVLCPRVILAVNGHLESFGFAKRRLLHIFLFATMTPALDAQACARLGGMPRWGITPSNPMGTTVRRIDAEQGGDRIITRTCAVLRPGMQATTQDMARAQKRMRSKFVQRFPQLADLRMEYAWAGHLCLSLNSVSVMRELESGVFAACVQNGLGTARGTLTGIGAAELACGHTSPVTEHFIAEEPPQKLPPQPLQQIGANMVLRLREWQARAD